MITGKAMAFQEEGTVSAKAPGNRMDSHVTKERRTQEVVMKFRDWRPGSGAQISFSVWVHFHTVKGRESSFIF